MVKTILVVEDDSYVREAALGILNNLGYQTHGAADGRVGLEAIETHSDVALLVCDVVLPGDMSGPDFARKAQERRPELKVLFMSGYLDVRNTHPGLLDREVKLLN